MAFYTPGLTGAALQARWPIGVLLGVAGIFAAVSRPIAIGKPIVTWTGLFTVLALFSCTYSFMLEYSVLRTGALLLLFGFSVGATRSAATNVDGLRRIFFLMAATMFFGTAIIAVNGAGLEVDFQEQNSRFQGTDSLRATGSAGLIAATVPILLWWHRYSTKRWKSAIVLYIVYLAILMVATKARSGIGMALVTWPMAYFALRSRKISKGWLAALIVLILAGVLVQGSESVRYAMRLEGRLDVSTGRFDRWKLAMEKWQERPAIGYGFGTSRYHHVASSAAKWNVETNREDQRVTHNEHVSVLYELGIVGLLVYWGCLYAILRAGYQSIQLSQKGFGRDMLVVVFISWLANAMNTIAHDANLTIGHPAAYLFWMQGTFVVCGAALLRQQERNMSRMTTTVGRV